MSTARNTLIPLSHGSIFIKEWLPSSLSIPTPLFLFHDSLGCVELWKEFPKILSEQLGRRVIAYDRLGFGKSSEQKSLPSIHFIEDEAKIFAEILKSLNIEEFDLLGHSVGGSMAIACAADIAGCRSVVTVSSQAFVEERTREGIRHAQESFKDPKQLDRLKKYHGEKALWVLHAWTDVWLSDAFSTWTLAPALSQVNCPVMALHGDSDEYGSEAFPKMIAQLTQGNSEFHIFPQCGHAPHREQPDLVLKHLKKFYSSL